MPRKTLALPGSFFINQHHMNHSHDSNKKWFFPRKNQETREITQEEVTLETWAWEAHMEDGSVLRQFEDDGVFHQIGEVDQEKLQVFSVYRTDNKQEGRYDLILPKGAKVIFKYRNYILNASTPNETRVRIFVFGYSHGKNKPQHFNFIMPDRLGVKNICVQSETDEITLTV
jgi:hypothetical protein